MIDAAGVENTTQTPSSAGRQFKFLRRIGKGGFGEVYLVEMSTSTGFTKTVAVKLLRADAQGNADVVRRMRDEARLLGLLRHRTIVQADDLITLAGRPAVVMEYVPGCNYSALINPTRFLDVIPPRVVLSVISQVASALDVAYNRPSTVTGEALQVLHRDIKPANVRITPDGEVKVLDFGIARSDRMNREATTSEYQLGSLPYMAPELLDGDDASPQSDVYSLGVMFYESLARARFGWAGESAELHNKQVTDRLAKVDMGHYGDIAEPAVELLISMMSFKAVDRPLPVAVSKRCTELERKSDTVSLEDWAPESVIAVLPKSNETSVEDAEFSGKTLFEEYSSSARLPEVPRDLLDDETLAVPISRKSSPAERGRSRGVEIAILMLLLLFAGGISVVLIWKPYEYVKPRVHKQMREWRAPTKKIEEAKEAEAAKAAEEAKLAAQKAAQKAEAEAAAKAAEEKAAKEKDEDERDKTPVATRFNSRPFGVKVYIDGKLKGKTPVSNLMLTPGRHKLEFVDGEYKVKKRIKVTAGGTNIWTYKRDSQAVK